MKCSIGESIVKGKVGIMASPNAFGGDGGVGVGGEHGGRGTKVSVVHSSAATTITTNHHKHHHHHVLTVGPYRAKLPVPLFAAFCAW